ncbi:MAG: response regulator transcription factor [Cyanobacteria bacterium J06641_5]
MSKVRVVLVEDHELTRVGIKAALGQFDDIEVVGEAADAQTGLRLLIELKPDVAAIDIGLPDMDGIELTERFKKDCPNTTSKVLMLTLQDSEDAVLAAFAAGADSSCMKDTSYELLVEALKLTKEGSSWIDPAIARIVLSQAQKSTLEPGTIAISTKDEAMETYPLTDRELEVLQLIVEGSSNADIAEKLYITVGTVKTHVRNILNKLCADDRTQAAVRALRSGLVA